MIRQFRTYETCLNIKKIPLKLNNFVSDKESHNFFDALDVDQAAEDFIKAYWVYPIKIRFELVEVEEP